jgi:hypothetical protein
LTAEDPVDESHRGCLPQTDLAGWWARCQCITAPVFITPADNSFSTDIGDPP